MNECAYCVYFAQPGLSPKQAEDSNMGICRREPPRPMFQFQMQPPSLAGQPPRRGWHVDSCRTPTQKHGPMSGCGEFRPVVAMSKSARN